MCSWMLLEEEIWGQFPSVFHDETGSKSKASGEQYLRVTHICRKGEPWWERACEGEGPLVRWKPVVRSLVYLRNVY